ncbi:MAG: tRNA (adenosine(37)-N6)-dimethylallyltransferase MiaA [Clostridia bacterium]|nr:tRNA (adenosine(37)-N6)-dimethylallyltransferase MiaA [Clostridia bacterium]
MSAKPKVVCIVGPTASGKTALGIEIAKRLDGEIISADSMQIYKGMPVASAVPTEEEKQGIKHHLMEICDPSDQQTVAKFKELATEKIKEVLERGKTPIIVGGTGLYIDAVVNNITYTPEEADPELRKKLEDEYDAIGGERMLEKLKSIDETAANRISKNDKKRIVRALELYYNSNVTVTKQYENSRKIESPYEFIVIGLKYADRQKLYDRINKRVDIMLENGLLDEAKRFYDKKGQKNGGFAAIGHKELFPFFDGEIKLEEAAENLKMQTRRYAKRQLTWFNKNGEINWIYPDVTEDVTGEAEKILKRRQML